MNVAISFPGCHKRGGVERIMLECSNFLAQRGHTVHAVCSEVEQGSLDPSVHLHRVSDKTMLSALSLPWFVANSAVVHGHLSSSINVKASFGMAAQPDSVIWMQSVHAAWMAISASTRSLFGRIKQRLNPFHPVILSMEKRMLRQRRYRHLIALSTRERDYLRRYYDVPQQDVTVLSNGYSDQDFNLRRREESRAAVRRELGLTPSDQAIIFVANEIERKGFRPLCRAVAKEGKPHWKIVAVGRFHPASVQSELQQLGLTEQVIFTGPTKDVGRFYSAADVFALPTQYEAWGLVIIEALASGLPVLTSQLAGASIAVKEGINGALLRDPSDVSDIHGKLHSLLGGAHADESAIAQSVHPYRWSQILSEYESILMTHCNSKLPRTASSSVLK